MSRAPSRRDATTAPVRRGLRPGLRVGMAAFGFDGSEVGLITAVQRRLGMFEITDDEGGVVLLRGDQAGLVGPDFVVLRGTGPALRAHQRKLAYQS